MSASYSSTLAFNISETASTLVLEIPEIVELIGSFIPLWTYGSDGALSFTPKALLQLGRVSTTWRRAFAPLVWRLYHLDYMKSVPVHILAKNTVYTRRLHSFDDKPYFSIQRASFPQLNHVTLSNRHRPLEPFLRSATTVTSLELEFASPVDDWATEMLSSPFRCRVKRLRLEHPNCNSFLKLHQILVCLPQLFFLHLETKDGSVNGISRPPFTNASLPIKELEIRLDFWSALSNVVLNWRELSLSPKEWPL